MVMLNSARIEHEYVNIDTIEVLGYLGGMHEVLSIMCQVLVMPFSMFLFNLNITSRYYGV